MQFNKENKNHWIALVATLCVMGVVVLVCCLVKMYAPDPPIPEEGVEIALGYDEAGLGENSSAEEQSNYSSPSAAGQYSTQSTEEAPALPSNSKGTKTNPNAQPNEKSDNSEPKINTNALFKGRTNPNAGQTGQGNTAGNGQQGDPNGNPNSSNYSGKAGSGNVNLKGRSAVALPSPSYNSDKQGQIVVKIWVDQQGNVTKTEAPYQGSTIYETQLVEQAKSAALRAKFNASTTAAAMQTGTITYVFRRSN